MNLPQAVSFPPQLRMDWDLSRRIPLVKEGELEPAATPSRSLIAGLTLGALQGSLQSSHGDTKLQSQRGTDRGTFLWPELVFEFLALD